MNDGFNPKEKARQIRGNEYLDVKWRIVWFRESKPEYSIITEISPVAGDLVVVRALVMNEQGHTVSSGMATVRDEKNTTWSGRVVEKAETAAIGRALAHLGFGTASLEDDADDLADSPVERKPQRSQQSQSPQSQPPQPDEELIQNVKVVRAASTRNGGLRIIAGDASGFPDAFKAAGIDTSAWSAGGDYELPFGLRVFSKIQNGYRNITRVEPISDNDDLDPMPF